MNDIVKVIKIKVEGKGCGSCIAPAKRYFIGLSGVRGVHIVGYNLYIIVDENVDPKEIIEKSGIKLYYWIRGFSVEEASIDEILQRIKRRSCAYSF